MIKLYELLFFALFMLVLIYSNLKTDTILIHGCTDIHAVNFNLNANTSDDSCKYIENINCNESEDPCLCIRDNRVVSDGELSCNELASIYFKRPSKKITSLLSLEHSNDVKFHALITTAYDEYFYSKLMEITQLSFMHYYHTNGLINPTDNINSRKTPQYLFYIALEHIKINDYKTALRYLNKFIRVTSEYNGGFHYYKFDGCCDWDLDWVKNKNHNSFDIANKIISILNYLESNYTESGELINMFNNLYELDSKADTIDLIDIIVFNFLINTNTDKILQEYKNNLLKQFKYIQIDNLNEPFNNVIGNFIMSSQIDMIVMLKILEAKKYIDSIRNNDPNKSLEDIKILKKYSFLINNYFTEYAIPVEEYIENEKKIVIAKHEEIITQKDTKENELYFLNIENNDSESIVSKWKNILDEIDSLNIKTKYKDKNLIDILHNTVNFSNFTNSINKVSPLQYFPIMKDSNLNEIKEFVLSRIYMDNVKKNSYYYNDSETNKEIELKSNYLNAVNIYYHTLNLFSKGSTDNIKQDLLTNNENRPLSYGHKILINSYSNWSIILKN